MWWMVVSMMCGAAGGALAGPPSREAKAHEAKGIAAYTSKHWPTAIGELKLAYQRERRPEYLVALGKTFGCATIHGGGLWCWGKNDLGLLGLGAVGAPVFTPQRVDLPCR